MGWIGRKLDSLAGTIVAAISGLAALQLPAFIHAYLQRLGGHIDEARIGLTALKGNDTVMQAGEAALRDRLSASAQARIDMLEAAQAAITQAGPFEQPVRFFSNLDRDIALATAQSFVPAVPLDVPSLIFAVIGIVLGWLIWDVIKAPARLLRRQKARI